MSFLGRDQYGFGAIRAEGEHLEYSLPASVMNALGLTRALAACSKDVDSFVRSARNAASRAGSKAEYAGRRAEAHERAVAQYATDPRFDEEYARKHSEVYAREAARAARSKKLMEGRQGALESTLSMIEAEVAQMRAQGIRGPIPVCLYRSSGKKGREAAWQVRQGQNHERFHAAVRRLEVRLGVRVYGLQLAMDELLKAEFGNTGYELSQLARWASKHDTITEELLARVEEQAMACAASTDDCRDNVEYNAKWIDQVNRRYGRSIPRTYLETLTADMLNRYGSAIGFVEAAAQRYPTRLLR